MADQNTALDLELFHQAIIDRLRAQFPGFRVVDDYPQDRRARPVPALYLDLEEMEGANDEDPGTGQQALALRFAARIILPASLPGVGRKIRAMAASLCAFVHLNRFGQPVNAAQLIGAYPDVFAPEELDQYLVWRVEWQQVGHFGVSVWEEFSQGSVPGDLLSGDGSGNAADYQKVLP
jgi:hypothetical protein